MKKENKRTYLINSISEQRRLYSLPPPEHPLVSLIHLDDVPLNPNKAWGTFIFNFYSIAIKRGVQKKLKYGQNYYDFDEGVMFFMAPNQIFGVEFGENAVKPSGWLLLVHPDFL